MREKGVLITEHIPACRRRKIFLNSLGMRAPQRAHSTSCAITGTHIILRLYFKTVYNACPFP